MCYSTKLTKKASEIEVRFKAIFDDLDMFHEKNEINAFTYPKTPIITNEQSDIIQHYSWGLIPAWAIDENIRKYTLNARIETITEKPSFKDNLNNRCIIISNGFYEWQWLNKNGSDKQKYEIGIANEDLFSFAGIWGSWYDEVADLDRKTFTIVTTEAKGIMKKIHNTKKRMPVILTKNNETNWLSGDLISDFTDLNIALFANKLPPNNSNRSQLSFFS